LIGYYNIIGYAKSLQAIKARTKTRS